MNRIILLAFAIISGLVVSCSREEVKPAPGITVELATYSEFDRAVQDAKGNVVAVDFWATWCPPCREKFPHLVALNQKYASKGLVCISVSLDEEDEKNSVIRFLNENKSTLRNYLWKDRSKMNREAGLQFEERYHFNRAIPLMVLFDREGKLVWSSTDQSLPPAAIDSMIATLLEKKS